MYKSDNITFHSQNGWIFKVTQSVNFVIWMESELISPVWPGYMGSPVDFPLSRDFSNFQVPGTFRVSRSCPARTTGPSRSLGPVLPGPRDLGPLVPGVPGVLAGPSIFFLHAHLVLGSCGFQWCGFHLCAVSKKSNYIWLMLIFIEFLHLCLKKAWDKAKDVCTSGSGKPPMDPETPLHPGNPQNGPETPPWLMLIFVFGSCLCTWLMLLYLAHAKYSSVYYIPILGFQSR